MMGRVKGAIDSGKIKLVREEVSIGQIFDRKIMPQINNTKEFTEFLNKANIVNSKKKVNGNNLRASQLNFDSDKIESLMNDPSDKEIIISSDGHVLDGHHRWIANNNMKKKCSAIEVDLPILELIKVAKDYNNQLNEELNHEKFGPMLDSFMKFASDKLGIKSLPSHEINKDEMSSSFAAYNPSQKHILITTKNRHPMDVFRSVAHELVHHKQNEDGRLGKDLENEGKTGSDIENEANSEAGKIMRWFAKENPEMFKSGYVVESVSLDEGINDPAILKAVFLAGGPGSGKDYVMSQTLNGLGLQEINSDVAFEFLMRRAGLDFTMPEYQRQERDLLRGRAKGMSRERQRLALAGRRGVIINGTADDPEKIATIKKELEDLGYETMMVFVNTSNTVSRQRNIMRGQEGGREVPESIRLDKWKDAQKVRPSLQTLFGNDKYVEIDNSNDLRKAPQEVVDSVLGQFNQIYKMVRKFARTPSASPEAKQWRQSEIEKRNMQSFVSPRATTMTVDRGPAKIVADPTMAQQSDVPSTDDLNQARRLGLSYYGFGRYGRTINGKHTVTHIMQNGKLVAKPKTLKEDLNEDLRKWFREKWVRFDTKGNIKGDCAREPGEGKPKCRPLASAVAMGKEARAKAARRKRREDPVANRKGKGGKPILVRTDEEVLLEKNVPTNPDLWSRAKSLARSKFDVYPSAYANGWAAKWYKSKGGEWKTKSVDESTSSNTPSDREWGTSSLARIYREATPGQTFPVNPLFEKKKKKVEEDNNLPVGGLPVSDGVGPMFTRARSPAYMGYTADIQESIVRWASQDHVIERYIEKYGEDAESKLYDTVLRLNESFVEDTVSGPKYFTHLREAWEAIGGRDMGTVAKQGSKEEVSEQGSFGSAFRAARESGQKEFSWKGKSYTSLKKGERDLPTSTKKTEPKSSDTPEPRSSSSSSETEKSEPKPMSRGLKTPEMLTKPDERNTDKVTATVKKMRDDSDRLSNSVQAGIDKARERESQFDADFDQRNYRSKSQQDQDVINMKKGGNVFTGSRHGNEGIDEDWQEVNRRDKTDGLSQSAVNAYRRENPGSKLQTAVTEKNPKGKRAKRRLSFCRRMGGMKNRLTSAKTARDPDSRINKALRRWNCEE